MGRKSEERERRTARAKARDAARLAERQQRGDQVARPRSRTLGILAALALTIR